MGKRCHVKNCQSGHTVDGVTVSDYSVFRVPQNPYTREKWISFLKLHGSVRTNRKSLHVCERHFPEKYVEKEYKCVDSAGNPLLERKFLKVRLAYGAVPVYPAQQEVNVVPGKSTVDSSLLKDVTNTANMDNEERPDIIAKDVNESMEELMICTSSDESIEEEIIDEPNQVFYRHNEILFYEVFSEASTLQLPDKSWGIHRVEIPRKTICVTQMERMPSEKEAPLVAVKQIVFYENLNFNTYIYDRSIPIPKANPKTTRDMESLIAYFHAVKVCRGGPPVAMYKGIVLRCAYKDKINRWRHNLCPLKTHGENMCKFCVKVYRNADACIFFKTKGHIPRSHLLPSTKKTIAILRKLKRSQIQTLYRNQVKLSQINEMLTVLYRREMS